MALCAVQYALYKVLANSTKICYAYNKWNRVTSPIDKLVYLDGAKGGWIDKHTMNSVIDRLIAEGYE